MPGIEGYAALAVGLLLFLLVSTFLQIGYMGRLLDDGQYFVGARSLAYGTGYRLVSRPGEVTLTKYPPGLSMLLSLPLRAMGDPNDWRHDEFVCRIALRVAGVGFGVALFAFYRKAGLASLAAALAALAVLFQPGVLVLNGRVLSDVPFAAVACALLWRWVAVAPQQRGIASAAIDGIIGGVLILLRSSGVATVPAILAGCLIGRQKVASSIVALSLCAGGWWLSDWMRSGPPRPPPGSGDYLAELKAGYSTEGSWYRNPANRLGEMLVVSGELLVPTTAARLLSRDVQWMYQPITWAIGAAGLLFMYVGFKAHLRRMDRRWIPPLLMVAGTLGVYAVWHVPFDYRFALPLSPLAMLWLSGGIATALSLALKRGSLVPAIMQVIWVLLAIKGVALIGVTVWRYQYVAGAWVTPADRIYLGALDVVAQSVERDAVIGAMAPEAVYFHTGRQSFPIIEDDDMSGRFGDWSRIDAWLAHVDPDRSVYLFAVRPGLPAIESRQLQALRQDRRDQFQELYTPPPYQLMRLRRR